MLSSASRPLIFRQPPLLLPLLPLYLYLLLAATRTVVSATEYIVGDLRGWVVGPNYTRWAVGKEFYVGDTLVFKYQRGDHNVIAVNREQYGNCTYPSGERILATGNDVVRLEEAGAKWYICGIPLHCQADQRLAITVLAAPALAVPSPSPAPHPADPRSGSVNGIIPNKRSRTALCPLLLLIILYHTLF